jgi:hypothetical protein
MCEQRVVGAPLRVGHSPLTQDEAADVAAGLAGVPGRLPVVLLRGACLGERVGACSSPVWPLHDSAARRLAQCAYAALPGNEPITPLVGELADAE